MAYDKDRRVQTESPAGTRIERRRLLALGAVAAVVAAGIAACAAEDENAGTRDNPFPYSEERTNRLRTRM